MIRLPPRSTRTATLFPYTRSSDLYSSTCPASAALSRQLNAERFAADFAAARPLSTGVVHDWLASERGLAATPHAQRSSADVRVQLKPSFGDRKSTRLNSSH